MTKEHKCPRCQEWTSEKDYCKACVSVLRQPPRLKFEFSKAYHDYLFPRHERRHFNV